MKYVIGLFGIGLAAAVLLGACGGTQNEAAAPSDSSGDGCEAVVKWSIVCYQLATERPGDSCESLANASGQAAQDKLGLAPDAAQAMGNVCGVVCQKQRGGVPQADIESAVRSSCSS
jgi:hypothetical protein